MDSKNIFQADGAMSIHKIPEFSFTHKIKLILYHKVKKLHNPPHKFDIMVFTSQFGPITNQNMLVKILDAIEAFIVTI